MPMVGPLQAHTNVRDVLAPLFSNGRSFSSLIDELSRHFRLEQSNGSRYPSYDAYGDDPVGVLEASSESQSTDSEAEGNLSDETDSRLVQARVSAQGRSSDTVAPVAAAVVAPQGAAPSPAVEQPPLPPLPGPSATGVAEPPPAQPEALAPTRRTRSRSRRQQQPAQASPAAGGGGVPSGGKEKLNKRRGGGGISSQNGDCSGAAAAAAAAATGGGGGGVGPAATGAMPSRSGGGGAAATTRSGKSFFSGDELTVLSVTANADGWSEAVGAALATRARAGYVFAQEVDPDSQQSTEFVREMFLDESSGARKALELRRRLIPVSQKVLLCSAWVDSGEYLAAAARLVAQCHAEVFGIACVRFEQNCSTEGLVDRFNLFAKSMPKGSVPPLNMGMKSCIPASLTKGFHGYTFNGGSRPGGPAQSASRGGSKVAGSSGAAGVDDGGGGGGGASGAVGAAGGCADGGAPAPGDDVGQDTRARKRRRSRDAPTGQNNVDAIGSFRPTTSVGGAAAAAATATATSAAPPTVVAPVAPAVASAPEPMEEDSMIPASDEVSAGEGVAEPGDGGRPAEGERFGGGALSEGERTAGVGSRSGDGVGGRGWRQLIGGAIFSEEEGDYAADSERSTDHEPVHLYGGGSGGGGGGGGGGRESDEHEMSEREVFRRSRGRSGRRGRGRSRGPAAQHGGGGGDGRAGSRPSSPETCLEADGESSSNRGSQQAASRRDGGGSKVSASTLASPKRRRIGTGIREISCPRSGAALDEGREQSGSLANSEASGSAEAAGSAGEEEEEETERHDTKDAETHGDRGGSGGGSGGASGGGGGGGGSNGRGASSGVGMRAVAPIEWKAKIGRQPIFMSRGLPEEDACLMPSHSGGETHGTGSPGRAVGGMSCPPVQDPELDRDRASSCSSADSPNPDRRPVSCGSGNGEARGGVTGKSFDETKGRASPSAAAAAAAATQAAAAQAAAAAQPPPTSNKPSAAAAAPFNSPGGVIPWHHTSVYEANNPTEDRHAELSHDALGIKVYCVCDGHGGSRAAQFVCDNLAADVLTRVESIEAAAAPATARGRGGSDAGGGDDDRAGREAEIRVSLADAFTSCDEQFIAQLDPTKNRGYINAGCCVVLALLVRSQLFLAHVGDCRVVLGTTDAARFPPDLLSTAKNTPSPSPPSSSGKGRVGAAGGKRGASGGKGGDGGPAAGRGRCSKGGGAATATATAGPRRVGSPLRAAGAADSELKAIALSRDHNCDDADEVALVRARSGDDNAIRASRNDEWKGARAIKRVAGSLAVTRAIGDAYLKRAVFSFSPYKEGVPYITAEPEVTVVELTSKDRFLVLASDGVWEQVSNEEAVQCVSGALASASGSMGRRQRSAASRTAAGGGGGGSGGAVPFTSDALVDFVLARSAQSHGMSVPALRALPRGSSRRMLHDDVCATVVHFTPAPPQQAPL